jgi:Kinesin-like protein
VFDPDINSEWSRRGEKSYVFDDVFDETYTTTSIYEQALKPALDNVLNGYNSTIFAYGMTGAGKTFTMFGDIYNSTGGLEVHPGIITLIVNDVFLSFEKERENGYEFNLKFSYIEIYNEQTRDLLSPTTENLMIVEDPQKGIIIPNLSEITITHHDEIIKYILQGNSRRIMASTSANQFSSRSHAIIQLTIEKRNRAKDIVETYTQSKLCLVDLAGSERAATSENRGIRQVEGANINRSLLALGNCINILSDSHKKGAFVPYRDSKLTRMLKDSLGGNTRTIMVACISPSYLAYEETINTLKYASRARKIKKKINKNVKEVELHVSQYREIINSLKAEIEILKKQLQESKLIIFLVDYIRKLR